MDPVPPWLMKRPAANKAVDDYLRDDMIVGLGTGNAANMAVDRITEYVRKGYDLTLVSSSIRTEEYAKGKGLMVSDINDIDHIDVTFDGADEVDPNLTMIKGLGGALLKEKIMADLTEKEIIIIDDFKRVDVLGVKTPLPVEVCRYAHSRTRDRLMSLGCEPVLRTVDNQPFVTDEGHLIYDCKFPSIDDPEDLSERLFSIPGVVECGLFIDLAYAVESYLDDGSVVEHRRKNDTYR